MPPIRVDPGRLMQVLFNLLGNAQQALSSSGAGGRILLRAGTVEEDGRRWVTVDVIDDGPGVPEAYIDRIFEPFFTTREDGTGYGLYLAAEILKEQSGRLTVRNNPEGGATFTIWLPADEIALREPSTTTGLVRVPNVLDSSRVPSIVSLERSRSCRRRLAARIAWEGPHDGRRRF